MPVLPFARTARQSYWEDRYLEKDTTYDWYVGYPLLRGFLLPALDLDSAAGAPKRERSAVRTLVVGCGNSPLSADLFEDGFRDLLSVDYSEVVVGQMRRRFPALRFEVMDVRDTRQPAASYDCIVDKGRWWMPGRGDCICPACVPNHAHPFSSPTLPAAQARWTRCCAGTTT